MSLAQPLVHPSHHRNATMNESASSLVSAEDDDCDYDFEEQEDDSKSSVPSGTHSYHSQLNQHQQQRVQRLSLSDDAQLTQRVTDSLGGDTHLVARYGPIPRQPYTPVRIQAQRLGLTAMNRDDYADIKAEWETTYAKHAQRKQFTNEDILRIVHFCDFEKKRAIALLRKTKARHLHLSLLPNQHDEGGDGENNALARQLLTKTLFPCPGLYARDGSTVFYMRPSRYFPNTTSVSLVIDNLLFVMDKLVQQNVIRKQEQQQLQQQQESQAPPGVAFIANMNDWTMANFSTEYCLRFMNGLQGRTFPAKVNLFLIVNPPSWFEKVWAIMKPMLAPTFRKKVMMIDQDELGFFMMTNKNVNTVHQDISTKKSSKYNYEDFLPDDILGGKVNTDHLVQEYVRFHQAVERECVQPTRGRRNSHSSSGSSSLPQKTHQQQQQQSHRQSTFKSRFGLRRRQQQQQQEEAQRQMSSSFASFDDAFSDVTDEPSVTGHS